MRSRFGCALIVGLLMGLPVLAEARAGEPVCDPLALDLSLTPQRTMIYASLKETVQVQEARPDKADVVLIGDSLLAGWRTDLPSAFPSTVTYDFAVGGDRVPTVLWRFENTDLSHLRPAVAVLLIGTNDLAAGTPSCAVSAGIEAIVEKLRTMWPETQVLALTIPPRGPDFHVIDDRRLEVNKAVVALGSRFDRVHAVPFDDNAFTCGQYAAAPLATGADPSRLSCANYADDNLHFSTEGYVQLGRILKDAAVRSLGRDVFH